MTFRFLWVHTLLATLSRVPSDVILPTRSLLLLWSPSYQKRCSVAGGVGSYGYGNWDETSSSILRIGKIQIRFFKENQVSNVNYSVTLIYLLSLIFLKKQKIKWNKHFSYHSFHMVLGNVFKEILGKFSTTNYVQYKFYLLINIMKHSVFFFAKICNPKWKA